MFAHQFDTTNCTGDYIYHSKNCHMCFDTRHTEDSGYITQANLDMGTKDSWDCGPIPTGMDLCYDVAYSHYLFDCQHLYWCGNLKNSQYCTNCMESENLFGCQYLQHKRDGFYILNQKVTEDYYREKTAEIKKVLEAKGIYTIYDLIYKDLSQGQTVVSDDQLNRKCTICSEPFEIIAKEIEFYKKHQIKYPIYCPSCRAKQRFNLRNEREVFKRKCDSCKKTLITTYPPDSPHLVYCLDCWWKHIATLAGHCIDKAIDVDDVLLGYLEIDNPRKSSIAPFGGDHFKEKRQPLAVDYSQNENGNVFLELSSLNSQNLQTYYSEQPINLGQYIFVGEAIVTPGNGKNQEWGAIFKPIHGGGDNHLMSIGFESGIIYVCRKDIGEWEPVVAESGILSVQEKWSGLMDKFEEIEPKSVLAGDFLRRNNGLRLMQEYTQPYPYIAKDLKMPRMAVNAFYSKPFSQSKEEAEQYENRRKPFCAEKGGMIIDPSHIIMGAEEIKKIVNQLENILNGTNDGETSIEGHDVYKFAYQVDPAVLTRENLLAMAYGIALDQASITEGISQTSASHILPDSLSKKLGEGLTPEDLYSENLGMKMALNELAEGKNPNSAEILKQVVEMMGVEPMTECELEYPLGVYFNIPVRVKDFVAHQPTSIDCLVTPLQQGWKRTHIAISEIILRMGANLRWLKKLI